MKNCKRGILPYVVLFLPAIIYCLFTTSCSKNAASASGLNIKYEVLNLSPDLGPVNLFIDFKQVNSNPYTFSINSGYFYVPSTDTPYQIRSALFSQSPISGLNRDDILTVRGKYSLFIVGSAGNNSLSEIFTVDTAAKQPPPNNGLIRFINASPGATGGLDLYANGTQVFGKILYTNVTGFTPITVGNYNIQTNVSGSPTVLNDQPQVTIQAGRVYTVYAYGYATRTDSAAFNVAIITNQ